MGVDYILHRGATDPYPYLISGLITEEVLHVFAGWRVNANPEHEVISRPLNYTAGMAALP